MKRILNKYSRDLVDLYLQFALSIDIVVIVIIWILNSELSLFDYAIKSKIEHIRIISNVITSSISLAGFILASLTIIVSIRSNVKMKQPDKATTPLELFFSTGIYNAIVKVFKIAIIELVFCFVISFIIDLLSENLENYFIFKVLITLIYLISMSTIRSLFVLFLLIGKKKKIDRT